MKIYKVLPERLELKKSLTEALNLNNVDRKIISIVGGGGKTTLMYALAKEYHENGKRVLVTTTTHIWKPDSAVAYDADTAVKELTSCGLITAGADCGDGKLASLPLEDLRAAALFADVVLIEADGAKGLPLKAPNKTEPVIIEESNVVIGVAGIDGVGKSIDKICFRPELAAGLLGRKTTDEVTAEDVAFLLTCRYGQRKCVGCRSYRIVLNKADNEKDLRTGREIAGALFNKGVSECLMTDFSDRVR